MNGSELISRVTLIQEENTAGDELNVTQVASCLAAAADLALANPVEFSEGWAALISAALGRRNDELTAAED